MSDINMTPLIDVMLVLLVIFILTAPLLAHSLRLDLPRSDAARAQETAAAVSVSLDVTGQLYLGEQRLPPAELQRQLTVLVQQNPLTEVQLRADRRVPYGQVAELIGLIQQAGLSRIGFVAEPQ